MSVFSVTILLSFLASEKYKFTAMNSSFVVLKLTQGRKCGWGQCGSTICCCCFCWYFTGVPRLAICKAEKRLPPPAPYSCNSYKLTTFQMMVRLHLYGTSLPHKTFRQSFTILDNCRHLQTRSYRIIFISNVPHMLNTAVRVIRGVKETSVKEWKSPCDVTSEISVNFKSLK